MLARLRGTARLPLRSGPRTLYSHAVCVTVFHFGCIALPLKTRYYSTRKSNEKGSNRRSEQSDLDISALRRSQKPERKRGISSQQPRSQRRDQHQDDDDVQNSARKRQENEFERFARERHEAMSEHQHANRQALEYAKEIRAFCDGCSGPLDSATEMQYIRGMMMLFSTFLKLDLVTHAKMSLFTVPIIFAPIGTENVAILHRWRCIKAFAFAPGICIFHQAQFRILLARIKLRYLLLERMEYRDR